MAKVLCALCKFEKNKRCIKKNSGVSLAKKRVCDMYEDDDAKLTNMAERKMKSSKPPVYFRPDWYWDRKNFIKKMKEDEIRQNTQRSSIFTGDPKHPLTGDLSRFFKSTVSDSNETDNEKDN